MLVRVGCDEMFVRVTVSDPYKQKPAQHCPLLRPSSEGGGPVQTFDVQTSGGAAAAARTEKYFPVADVWTSECWDGNFGEVGTSYVCTCRVRDPECLYGSGRAYPYKHSGGGPVQTFACTGPLREMFVRVCFLCIRVPPPRQFCMPRPLDFGRLLQSGRPGWRLLQKKGARKSWRGSASSEEGEFPVIMVLAAPQSGLKGGPVQTSARCGIGPLLKTQKLGRVHFCGCWAGSTAQMFVRVHLWTISGKTNIQGVIFRHRIHGPVQTFRRPNIRFFGEKLFVRVHYARGGDDVGTGPLPQGGKVPAEAGPTFMIFYAQETTFGSWYGSASRKCLYG